MRPALILTTLALGVSALASDRNDAIAGAYRLELSQEAKTTNQKLGLPEPFVRIMLRPDGTFSYAGGNGASVASATGTYELRDRQIRLIARDGFPAQGVKSLAGRAEDNALILDGLRYVKAGATVDLVGVWTLRSGGREDRSVKMVFKENRTFEFSGMAATSKGRYEIDGDRLTLVWSEVDGEAVEPGSMRKVLYLREDGTFYIDTYRYAKG